jgi:hypothetical protein
MFCPQCGTESGSGLQYCRSCGANLKVIGKALTLSEAIARSDRGPVPRIKEMVRSLKVEHVGEEVSRALERMNQEIVSSPLMKPGKPWGARRKKTPEERRENLLVKGTVSLFSGIGLTIFLYYFAANLVLKLPPQAMAQIPFELDPVVHILWLLGLIPILTGVGRILAGLSIRRSSPSPSETNTANPFSTDIASPVSIRNPHPDTYDERNDPGEARLRNSSARVPASVTEHTTNLLDPPE